MFFESMPLGRENSDKDLKSYGESLIFLSGGEGASEVLKKMEVEMKSGGRNC